MLRGLHVPQSAGRGAGSLWLQTTSQARAGERGAGAQQAAGGRQTSPFWGAGVLGHRKEDIQHMVSLAPVLAEREVLPPRTHLLREGERQMSSRIILAVFLSSYKLTFELFHLKKLNADI